MDEPKTPWAVICQTHGQVFLNEVEYERQLSRPDDLWHCPICSAYACWDDDNYQESLE